MAIDTTEAQLFGTGKGAAYVWGANRGLQGLQQAYQQEQLRRQKEDAELADQVAKINYDGARDADLPEILKRYDGLKNTFAKIRGTQNQMERIKLQTELNQQKADISRAVALSKQAGQQEGELGKIPLNNPDNISDDFVPSYSKLRKTSVFSPDYQKQAEYITTNGVLPKFDNLAYSKNLLDRSVENIQSPEVQKKSGRLNYTVRDEGSRLNPENVLKNAVNAYMSDRKFQRYIDREFKGIPPEQAVQEYAKSLYESNKDAYNKVKEKNVRQYMDEAPDRFYEHYNYRLANPINNFVMVDGTGQQLNVPMATRTQKTGNVIQRDVVKVPTASMNFAGSPAYDFDTGKPTQRKLPSSNDYQIVTVSNMPFIKKGSVSQKELEGSMAQPDFAEKNPGAVEWKPMIHVQYKDGTMTKNYAIPYDRLPQNLSKQNRALLATFKPAQSQSQPTTQTKPVKSFKGVPKGGF